MARNKKTRPDVRTINLRSGGTVTVELTCSAFDLDDKDRDFVTEVVDLFRGYENKASSRSTARSSNEKVQAKKGQKSTSEEPAPAT